MMLLNVIHIDLKILQLSGGFVVPDLKAGDLIGIPCEVSDGPFEDDLLVQFDTLNGPVSGFASGRNVNQVQEQFFIKGKIKSIEDEYLVVMVEGSFFTTNGLASIGKENLLPIAA